MKRHSKYFGIIMVLLEWFVLLILYSSFPKQLAANIALSDFLGIQSSRLIFICGFIAVTIIFYMFINLHLKHELAVPVFLFNSALLSLLIALFAPYETRIGYILHVVGASTFAILYYLAIIFTGINNKDKLVKIICYGTVLLLVLLFIYLFKNWPREGILAYEIAIGACGQIWIILISIFSISYTKKNLFTEKSE